jgi:hypothetical protein
MRRVVGQMSHVDPRQAAIPDEDDPDLIIMPGERAPFVIPWCARCKDTVEKFTFDHVTSPFRVGVQAQCHGETAGIWVTQDDLFKRKKLGQPVVLFKRRAFNLVR